MRAKHDAGQGYYTTIATKISLTDKQKLCAIANGFQMSFYELLQSLLLAIVRYFDTDTLISHESDTMLNAFANVMFATAGSFSPLAIKGHQQQSVKSAILFVQRKDGQQPQTIAIGKDGQGRLTETYNTDKMLADYLQATDPEILKVLEDERKRMELFSIGHTLHELILQASTEPKETIGEEINALFDDIRIPSGQATNKDVHYKGKYNRGDYTQVTPHRQTYRADL